LIRFLPNPNPFVAGLFFLTLLPGPPCAQAQEVNASVKEAYFRTVAKHFGVSPGEASILGDWDLDPDEVPVVLFVSKAAGVAPDALVGFRRSGRSWMDVASRYGLTAATFHVAFPPDAALGSLARAYAEYRGVTAREWVRIELRDPEILALVNVRVLSAESGVPPHRIIQLRDEAGSFVAAFPRLGGGS